MSLEAESDTEQDLTTWRRRLIVSLSLEAMDSDQNSTRSWCCLSQRNEWRRFFLHVLCVIKMLIYRCLNCITCLARLKVDSPRNIFKMIFQELWKNNSKQPEFVLTHLIIDRQMDKQTDQMTDYCAAKIKPSMTKKPRSLEKFSFQKI